MMAMQMSQLPAMRPVIKMALAFEGGAEIVIEFSMVKSLSEEFLSDEIFTPMAVRSHVSPAAARLHSKLKYTFYKFFL